MPLAQIYIDIIDRCSADAELGNATHMRSFIKSLSQYKPETVKFAVHTLAAGEVPTPIYLHHVGSGYYELCDGQ